MTPHPLLTQMAFVSAKTLGGPSCFRALGCPVQHPHRRCHHQSVYMPYGGLATGRNARRHRWTAEAGGVAGSLLSRWQRRRKRARRGRNSLIKPPIRCAVLRRCHTGLVSIWFSEPTLFTSALAPIKYSARALLGTVETADAAGREQLADLSTSTDHSEVFVW